MRTMILLTMISAIMNTGNVETAVANVTCSIRSVNMKGINYVENTSRRILEQDEDEGWDYIKIEERDGHVITTKISESGGVIM